MPENFSVWTRYIADCAGAMIREAILAGDQTRAEAVLRNTMKSLDQVIALSVAEHREEARVQDESASWHSIAA